MAATNELPYWSASDKGPIKLGKEIVRSYMITGHTAKSLSSSSWTRIAG